MEKSGITIQWVSVDSIQPNPNNPKRHPESQISQLVKSMEAFGFNDPLALGDNNELIAGHGRLQAAKALGLNKVPVIYLKHLTPEQRKAYAIAHNQLCLSSGFDDELLKLELLGLDELNLSLTGFDEDTLAGLLNDPIEFLSPEGFQEVDESLPTQHQCPKCGFEWS